MAKPNLIGGAAYLKIDGVQHMSRGNWTYNHGMPSPTTVFDGANTVGYVEAPQEPLVEGDMTVPAGLDVGKLVISDDITLTLELDNGNVVVLRNAWFAGEGTVNVQEGSMPAKFVGLAVLAPLARAMEGVSWSSLFGGGSAAYGTTGAGTSSAGMISGGTNPGFLLGGVATGGAFEDGRLLTAYARGGIVDTPTVFPMAHGYGLMGEAGPEAVMPLKRLASGNLGVEATPAGVTVNVYNNAGAQVRTETRRDPGGGLTIDVMIDALEQQLAQRLVRPGTPLNGALRAAANPVRAR